MNKQPDAFDKATSAPEPTQTQFKWPQPTKLPKEQLEAVAIDSPQSMTLDGIVKKLNLPTQSKAKKKAALEKAMESHAKDKAEKSKIKNIDATELTILRVYYRRAETIPLLIQDSN